MSDYALERWREERDSAPETAFYRRRVVTARKDHRCDICRQMIRQGQRYTYSAGVSDGVFSAGHAHLLDPNYECIL